MVKTYDIVKFGFSSLTHRKLRSWLTVIGIVIGVASVVALISIGQGAQAQITSRLSGLGADIITITPGHSRAAGGGFQGFGGGGERAGTSGNLTSTDVKTIKTVQGVLYVNGIVSTRADVSYLGQSVSTSIQGVDTSGWRFFIETTGLSSGRYLNQGDTNAVVIGSGIANGLFKQNLTINKQITINGTAFTVVGILQSTGSFGQGDSIIYMPIDAARQTLDLDLKKLSSISIKVADSSQTQDIANQIESKLLIARHLQASKEDFTVSTAAALQSQVSSVTGTLTLFLAAIAGISLLVGAIGISNTMFMSVMERTRQIGILKSIGATDSEIMKIFVTESSLIGFFGGVLGVLFGMTASGLISELSIRVVGVGGAGGGFTTVVTPDLIIFSVLFSTFIGAVSGLLPARRAAKLQPVEALRYE